MLLSLGFSSEDVDGIIADFETSQQNEEKV